MVFFQNKRMKRKGIDPNIYGEQMRNKLRNSPINFGNIGDALTLAGGSRFVNGDVELIDFEPDMDNFGKFKSIERTERVKPLQKFKHKIQRPKPLGPFKKRIKGIRKKRRRVKLLW